MRRMIGIVSLALLFYVSIDVYSSGGYQSKTGRQVPAKEAKWHGAIGITVSVVGFLILLASWRKHPSAPP